MQRAETETALRHTQVAVDAARGGRPLVFYPEAVIMRTPGLLEFHLGAFVSAVEAGVPVVPVAIRGCRSALRHEPTLVSPPACHLACTSVAPSNPKGRGFAAALALRNRARAEVLAHCGEPDLALEADGS